MNVLDDEENKNTSMSIRWNIYILYWTATVSSRCPLREVRDKSNIHVYGQSVEPATCQMD